MTSDKDSQFTYIISRAMSRRDFMGKSALLGLSTLAMGSTALSSLAHAGKAVAADFIGFTPIKAETDNAVHLPAGYSYDVLIAWGDPLFADGAEFDYETRGTAQSQAVSFGDNTDGMEAFETSNGRMIMAVNNEYTNIKWLIPSGKLETADDIRKTQAAHGISIFEIVKTRTGWKVDRKSRYNRRITPNTEMEITGIARGSDWLKTSADPKGIQSLGTWNNCGSGRTPWGTYLTCEENFDKYFAASDSDTEITPEYKRYGVGVKDAGYRWYKIDSRFDIAKEPNEPNRVGYVVEIDVEEPNSRPRKLTSLGRFKHENAELVVNKDGRIVVYMGDDQRGEYLYKYVSDGVYKPSRGKRNNRLLEEGTLYVAKFGEANGKLAGRGKWIPLIYGKNGLTQKNGFHSQADIQVFPRMAADIVGATTMDRPEWVAASPHNSAVYCCLTNNKQRGVKDNAGGFEQVVNGPNPRAKNNYGQIIRWMPDGDDHTGLKFSWNLFVVAGNPLVQQGLYAGTDNITPENMFNSPDGLKFDTDGRLWIQTDGKYSNKGDYEGMGNNQMLCAHPHTGEIKRFMVGPTACEVTGLSIIDNNRTMFVGIQHPEMGKDKTAFPFGNVPRSAIIMITKDDGGVIGT